MQLNKTFASVMLALFLVLLGWGELRAQCPNDNAFYTNMTPSGVGAGSAASNTCIWGGDYVTVDVCSGAQYIFSTCASAGFDTEITVYNDANGAFIAHNDDAPGCVLQSEITWTATFTGTVRVLVDEYPCVGNVTCQEITVTQVTPCGGGGGGNGNNCSTPTAVACGDTLTNQTTLGNGNDAANWSCFTPTFATPGEDHFYAVTITDPATTTLRVSLMNVVDADAYVEVVLVNSPCSATTCDNSVQYDVALGTFANLLNSNDFSVPGAGTYYIIIDSQGDGVSSYDIGFECLASGINLDRSGCTGPPADTDMNGYEVTWNGSATIPTMVPGMTGTICYTLYIENPTGFEWLKYADFTFGSCWTGVTNISPNTPPPNNGYYNTMGEWTGAYNAGANEVNYVFTNSNNPAWGDGDINNYGCYQYQFCFDATVAAGCTQNSDLNIVIYVEDDGFGGSGFTIPSNDIQVSDDFILPVVLETFAARAEGNAVELNWSTLRETNNAFFTVEKSIDGIHYEPFATVNSLGNSQQKTTYKLMDTEPAFGANYYRLSQTDLSGDTRDLGVETVTFEQNEFGIASLKPNPATEFVSLQVSNPQAGQLNLQITDVMGKEVRSWTQEAPTGIQHYEMDLKGLAPGIYFVKVAAGNEVRIAKLIKE